VRKEGWKGRITAFLRDLERGKFDPDITESETEPVSSSKESAANGEYIQPDANGAVAPVDENKPTGGEDEIQFHIDVEEDGADQEASRADASGKSAIDTKRINRGEEISIMPEGNQVMIRTIPPDIGRVKLEEVRTLMFHLIPSSDIY
jgi:hypothetical protein